MSGPSSNAEKSQVVTDTQVIPFGISQDEQLEAEERRFLKMFSQSNINWKPDDVPPKKAPVEEEVIKEQENKDSNDEKPAQEDDWLKNQAEKNAQNSDIKRTESYRRPGSVVGPSHGSNQFHEDPGRMYSAPASGPSGYRSNRGSVGPLSALKWNSTHDIGKYLPASASGATGVPVNASYQDERSYGRERSVSEPPASNGIGSITEEFSYEQLVQKPPPDGVITNRLEEYLSDAEFKTLFHMSRGNFNQLPRWKQTQKKRDLQLF